ncbi:MAG: glycoside hydrolase family 32 protein [Cyclobacteriaceae bacterium]
MNASYSKILAGLVCFITCACQPKTQEIEEDTVQATVEREQHRSNFHFTPPHMWMNDPNGMVYYDGEYHLFYQHYPDSTVWGPMHWGHAISTDLVTWEHLPIALYPDSLGYIFSGSAVVDWNNTSGFGAADQPPMIAIYTYHQAEGSAAGRIDYQTQGIAYSLDKGRTWAKYDGNPVIPNPGLKDFRDPKVSWHEGSQQWVMIFAVGDHVRIYNSPDLKAWTLASSFGKDQGSHGGVWECPDLFPLQIVGTNETKWIMIVSLGDGSPNGGSGTMYFIGDFDGETFKNSNPSDQVLWIDYGRDNYAGVTWSDIPEKDGRTLFLGWMSNWQYAQIVPTKSWRSAMTVPRSLSLKSTDQGLRVVSSPVSELEALRGSKDWNALDLQTPASFENGTAEVSLEASLEDEASDFHLQLSNALGEKLAIGYQSESNQFYVDRQASGKVDFSPEFSGIHYAPRLSEGKTITIQLLIDAASVELFADSGETVMTEIFFPNEDFNQMELMVDKGQVAFSSSQMIDL